MKNNNVKKLVLSAIFLAFAIILQVMGSNFVNINPLLIGPLISTLLLLTTYICGLGYGVLVSLLIPALAVPLGALAPLLIPFAPFIVVGNIAQTISFAIFMKNKKYGLYVGVLISSIVKFLVLTFFSTKLLRMIDLGIPETNLAMIGKAFSLPQLIVALLGGIIAIIILKLLTNRKIVTTE